MSRVLTVTLLSAFLLAQAVTASAVQAAESAPSVPRAENKFLSQADAALRSRRVSAVTYALDFTLTGESSFSGTSVVDFKLSDTHSPLTLDLDKAKISSLVVNGKKVAPQYNDWFITLQPSDLKVGANTVSVSYARDHSTNGEGLHRFKDPTDGRVYLYSHFEPAAAHQMFALFDQPDLKATYRLSVTAPKEWHVVSAMRETAIKDNGATRRWTFPATPVLSPYNFSMHAGPYQVWEDKRGKYPMRLFARQSVAAQVSPKQWFDVTSKGLVYFDEYFGIDYPFLKYDQLLVPQFIYGAMENAGAVTFSERNFLSASAMTTEERDRLGSVILHEMAHQWFGDLVTMTWWNGLWLNESFASYMAMLGKAGLPAEFNNPWLSFYRSKQGAYRTDESITTHPIEVPVPSTANAFDNIDAITYNKGASVLHQLRKSIGDEAFRRGVHDYLVEFSYRNATLDDFIAALSKASGRDLAPWARQWLYQPGLNTLSADFSCKAGLIERFSLKQSAANAAWPTLREQLVQVGLFNLGSDKLQLSSKQAVTYNGASTDVPALVGKACPDLVYPNFEDFGFAKVVLDPVSFATAQSNLARIEDPMLRSMVWQSLSDGLRDGRIGLTAFTDAVLDNAPLEKDYALLGQALTYLVAAREYLGAFGVESTPSGKRTAARIEDVLWTGLNADRGNRDRASKWLTTYISVASTPAAVKTLGDILAGRVDAGGVEIDQDLRWSIIRQLNRRGAEGSLALIEAERLRDKSEGGDLAALGASVVRPDAAVKAEWLGRLQKLDGSDTFSRQRTVMRALYPAGQEALSEMTAGQRLQTLPEIEKAADPVFMRSYSGSMLPASCTAPSVARLAAAIESMAKLSAGTQRALLSAHEDDARCLAIRQAYDSAPATN